jgi:chemotaxis protein MotA
VREEGLMSLERDIDAPQESALFARHPLVSIDDHLLDFITDYLRLLVSGTMDAFQVENLMDNEIATYREHAEIPVHAIHELADGMPAFGIVAAVMGVVHTMGAAGRPPAELGGHAPAIAVEFGRKVISAGERPGFAELEGDVRPSRIR